MTILEHKIQKHDRKKPNKPYNSSACVTDHYLAIAKSLFNKLYKYSLKCPISHKAFEMWKGDSIKKQNENSLTIKTTTV